MTEIREGLHPDLGPQGQPNLTNPMVVGKLVHDFVAATLEFYRLFQRGKLDRGACLNGIAASAKRSGDIIMGRDPACFVPEWQQRWLKANIRAQDTISFKETDDPGEAFFRWLGAQAVQAGKDLDDGTAREEVGPQIQATMHSAVNFILTIGG